MSAGLTREMSVGAGMMEDVTFTSSWSSPLIGRAADLQRLSELAGLRNPHQGASGVLVSGDAGVGKTRLLSEFMSAAHTSAWRVLLGRCLDFADGALSYLPFSDALGAFATQSPSQVEALTEAYPALSHLLPGRRLLTEPTAAPEESTAKAELFEALHAALDDLAADSPVLVVIEDLHWADASTREMLTFLFTRQFTHPVTIVGSYRSDDMHRRHPLRLSLAEWSRVPDVHRIGLHPLHDADIRTLVRALKPGPLQESKVQAIVSRAEGNAFFTEELVEATTDDGNALPDDLSHLLLVRLDQIDDATRAVVRAAAVAGRRVSHALLARVVGLETTALDNALRAAVESNLLTPSADEGYSFRHALLAEAVYDDLLPGERVRLHLAYVEALLSHDIAGTAAELARHAREAHDVDTALRASIKAGEDAMSVGGPDEAAQHFMDALEHSAALDAEHPPGSIGAAALTVKTAEALTAAGRPHKAVSLLTAYLSDHPQPQPAEDHVEILIALATAALVDETDVDALAVTTEALNLISAEPASAQKARVMAAHARTNLDRDRNDDAMRWAGEAQALADDLGLAAVKADAKTTLANLQERAGDPEESMRTLEAIVERALAEGDPTTELRSLHNLGGLHFAAGRFSEAFTLYERATHRAEQLSRPWAPYGIDARVLAGVTAYYMGDWDAALRICDVTGQRPSMMAETALAAVAMAPAAGRGDTAALDLVDHLRAQWHRDGMVAILMAAAAIDLYGDSGDLAAAVEVHDAAVELVSSLWQNPTFHARVRLSGLLLGQFASYVDQHGPAGAPRWLDRAEEVRDAAAEAFDRHQEMQVVGPESRAWMERVRAEDLRLRWLRGVQAPSAADLAAAWRRTLAAFEEFGHVFELARTQARLACILRAVGDAAEARSLADRARQTAERLHAQPLLKEVRAIGFTAARSSSPPAAPGQESLTSREEEILGLVAQGRSNGEIARHLYISPKTVSVHVSNILAKLDAHSRTEAAALARQRGLLPT